MILSASRRTDIPTFFSEWFFNRIREGFFHVRNPLNANQVSRVAITPDVVDCIVFWTKNPIPMIPKLDGLREYKYYFQFTLTGYANDIEANLPDKKSRLLPAFSELSEKIGPERVIWRYDPIVISERYTKEYHLKALDKISTALEGRTEKCVISFVDVYAKNKKNMEGLGNKEPGRDELNAFAKEISDMLKARGIIVATCSESIDLSFCGIEHNQCIDKALIERIAGYPLKVKKDPSQREECGCMQSMEMGAYNTCKNGCKYCYANFNEESVLKNVSNYDPCSTILCDTIRDTDRITNRPVKSLRDKSADDGGQLKFF